MPLLRLTKPRPAAPAADDPDANPFLSKAGKQNPFAKLQNPEQQDPFVLMLTALETGHEGVRVADLISALREPDPSGTTVSPTHHHHHQALPSIFRDFLLRPAEDRQAQRLQQATEADQLAEREDVEAQLAEEQTADLGDPRSDSPQLDDSTTEQPDDSSSEQPEYHAEQTDNGAPEHEQPEGSAPDLPDPLHSESSDPVVQEQSDPVDTLDLHSASPEPVGQDAESLYPEEGADSAAEPEEPQPLGLPLPGSSSSSDIVRPSKPLPPPPPKPQSARLAPVPPPKPRSASTVTPAAPQPPPKPRRAPAQAPPLPPRPAKVSLTTTGAVVPPRPPPKPRARVMVAINTATGAELYRSQHRAAMAQFLEEEARKDPRFFSSITLAYDFVV